MKFGGILIALAIALAGCSGEPTPKEPQKTTSPTPKSTATPPVMPEQAKEDSPEGAAAFVSYWVLVSNFAAATGDTDELERISDARCAGCMVYVKLYRTTYAAGGYFRGGFWNVGKLEVEPGDRLTFVSTTISLERGRSRASSTAQEITSPPTSDKVTFAVTVDPADRRVTELVLGDGR